MVATDYQYKYHFVITTLKDIETLRKTGGINKKINSL